jgi:dCTP deaminase
MILSGKAIEDAVRAGLIIIEPFSIDQITTNSYDFRLGARCKIYKDRILDAAKQNPTIDIKLGDRGIVLKPNRLYLFNTLEKMGSNHFVPIIRGRSSVGRLGIFINITADLIDIGSINQWTLQLHCVSPVRVYPGMLIGQVTFWKVAGEITLYNGKYAKYESPVPSLSFLDEYLLGFRSEKHEGL